MTVVQISTVEELNAYLEEGAPVIVDFSGLAWCVPCQRLHPHYEAVAEKLQDQATFLLVDVDTADKALLDSFHVSGVPLVLALNVGDAPVVLTKRNAPQLLSEISQLL